VRLVLASSGVLDGPNGMGNSSDSDSDSDIIQIIEEDDDNNDGGELQRGESEDTTRRENKRFVRWQRIAEAASVMVTKFRSKRPNLFNDDYDRTYERKVDEYADFLEFYGIPMELAVGVDDVKTARRLIRSRVLESRIGNMFARLYRLAVLVVETHWEEGW
jgi:hypothetical protein